MAKRDGFDEWMMAVDRAVWRIAGVFADDLPDWNYRDAYDAGMTPGAAALAVLDEAGFDEVMA